MIEKLLNTGSWISEFFDVFKACDRASWKCHELKVRGENAKTAKCLVEQIVNIKKQIQNLLRTLRFSLLGKAQRGQRLTQEEYHLLQSVGIPTFSTAKSLGIFPIDDYALFCLLRYDGEDSSCYIDIEEEGIGFLSEGIPPEKLKIKYLRLEQKEFFQKYMPDVLRRFQKD